MNAPNIRALLEKPRRVLSAPEPVLSAEQENDSAADYEPFARGLIGNRPQLVLLFRKASGAVRGFSYSYFYGIETDDPAAGFTIDFTHAKVMVIGRNLERLLRLVCDHRAAEIVEARRGQHLEEAESAPVVEEIRFNTRKSIDECKRLNHQQP